MCSDITSARWNVKRATNTFIINLIDLYEPLAMPHPGLNQPARAEPLNYAEPDDRRRSTDTYVGRMSAQNTELGDLRISVQL